MDIENPVNNNFNGNYYNETMIESYFPFFVGCAK